LLLGSTWVSLAEEHCLAIFASASFYNPAFILKPLYPYTLAAGGIDSRAVRKFAGVNSMMIALSGKQSIFMGM
jgi:hypothetical protein